MSITQQGISGEKAARLFLRKHKVFNIQQIDWLVRSDNPQKTKSLYYAVEVKAKKLFKKGGDCPFDGQGLDIKQIERRELLRKETGFRTLLLVFSLDDNIIYCEWLDALNADDKHYFDTKNGLRIYDIKLFCKCGKASDYYKAGG